MKKTTVELRALSDIYLENLGCGNTTKGFDIKAYIQAIAGDQARKGHEAWCQKKMAAGYTYGKTVDDEKKTSNLLVPFDQLPDSYKEANISNAVATVELMMNSGVLVGYPLTEESKEAMILNMAEALHDRWVITKMNQGYVYGEKRNDDPSKGELCHRDMLPFDVLQEVYPEDVAYDCDTARGMIEDMIASGMMLFKIAS